MVNDDQITYDPEIDAYVVDVHLDSPDAAADAIVTAVASLRDTDPIELPSLADVVDTDALGAVFRPEQSDEANVRVAFDYAGFRVTIAGDGTVRLTDKR